MPDLGGNSDTGIEIGVGATYARFAKGYRPYRYRFDVVLGTSFKVDDGFRLVQHRYALRLDTPGLLDGKLRLDTRVAYVRQGDIPWYGAGNATGEADLPPPPGDRSPTYYRDENVRFRSLARYRVAPGVDLTFGTHLRHERPGIYVGTKLDEDVRSGAVVGGQDAFLASFAGGLILDTRDDEFITRKGIYYQLGAAETLGTAEGVHFGEVSAVLMHYVPLTKWLTFASRMFASFKFGTTPFYELQQGGVFDPIHMIGGYRGVRGLNIGRFAGDVKLLTNAELRFYPFPSFKVVGKRMLIGFDGFFDAGRVFRDYEIGAAADGRRLGVKTAGGGGLLFQWDTANVFRVEVAASPQNGGEPLFYFENGTIF